MKTLRTLYVFCSLLLSVSTGFSQSNTLVAGGDATGTGGSVSYSVGQVSYVTVAGSTGILTEGVQQPVELYPIGIRENDKPLPFVLFPNPAGDFITVDVSGTSAYPLTCRIFDMNGKLVSQQDLYTCQTCISLAGLPAHTYLLKVSSLHHSQTFKLIKHR